MKRNKLCEISTCCTIWQWRLLYTLGGALPFFSLPLTITHADLQWNTCTSALNDSLPVGAICSWELIFRRNDACETRWLCLSGDATMATSAVTRGHNGVVLHNESHAMHSGRCDHSAVFFFCWEIVIFFSFLSGSIYFQASVVVHVLYYCCFIYSLVYSLIQLVKCVYKVHNDHELHLQYLRNPSSSSQQTLVQ